MIPFNLYLMALEGVSRNVMSNRLEGKVAVITGGNSGIGPGSAERFGA